MIVPFGRTLRRGMAGRDVVALQRALVVARCRTVPPTGVYDQGTVRAVGRFQQRSRLHVDWIYGQETHRKLAPSYDAYGVWLLTHPRESVRQRIVACALFGVNNAPEIHYSQGVARWDGIRRRLRPPAFPRYTDCSAFATWCYWVASSPVDPNGQGFAWGFTGTMTQHGERVQTPRPGDLVFYGHPISHVAVYCGQGKVVSHGSEAGPLVAAAGYRPVTEIRSYLA